MSEKYLNLAVKMTNTYRQYRHASPQLREAMCMKALYPEGLMDLRETDLYAGRADVDGDSSFVRLPVVFNPKKESQGGYYCSLNTLKEYKTLYPERVEEIDDLIEFWKKEATFVKIREEAPPAIHDYLMPYMIELDEDHYMRKGNPKKPLGTGFISGGFDTRMAGVMPDFSIVLKSGIPGLLKKIDHYEAINGANAFYEAARLSLEMVLDTLEHYRAQAEALIATAAPENVENLKTIAQILENLKHRAPHTLREAIQLVVIFCALIFVDEFGRIDMYLGDFLAHDLDTGILTEEEAINLILGFWRYINETCGAYDTRVIIGGMGRHNEANADRFALLAMEATRRYHEIKPVLTLRLYQDQNPALYEKALDVIAEGCIYPTLYNDDVIVPGAVKSMDLPLEDAVDYAPLGCGEFILAQGKSVGSPNSTFRMLKALEAALHGGRDGVSGNLIGVPTPEAEELDTFEKLYDAFLKQLDARLAIDAEYHAWNRKITARECGFVLMSLLMRDCIENGADIMHGGIRYFGSNLEGFGLTNTINSFAVIKKLVYEEKKYTLKELVHILDVNFEGYEEDRKLFLSIDKFGNDKAWVDDMKLPIEAFLNERANYYAKRNGLHYCTVASVNPGGITIGPSTAASADGRKCGEPFALANSPMPGTDVSGLTAMLLSTAKADPRNGGYVTNMHLSRETITQQREKVSDLFKTYFRIGGQQLNINCFSKNDLKNAIKEPEKYRHVIVRISGYSARFVDLDPITQNHLLNRTIY